MSGTRDGGLKAKQRNLEYDPDFYKKIGAMGGKNGKGHAFAHGKVDPRAVGKLGGRPKGWRLGPDGSAAHVPGSKAWLRERQNLDGLLGRHKTA